MITHRGLNLSAYGPSSIPSKNLEKDRQTKRFDQTESKENQFLNQKRLFSYARFEQFFIDFRRFNARIMLPWG